MNMMKLIFASAELAITIMCGVGAYLTITNYLANDNQLDLFGGIGLSLATIIGVLCFIEILKED